MSDAGFDAFLSIVADMLPKENKVPANTYYAKKLISRLTMGVEKIHVCRNHCILYRGDDYKDLESCPKCGASRYKTNKDYREEECVASMSKGKKRKKAKKKTSKSMTSSRSTLSRHCFMAPVEAVELGGWRSNSLAADNAPGAAIDGVWDACAGVCYRATCTAAAPVTGRLDTRGAEDATSSSTTKSSEVSPRCSTICTIMPSKKTSKNLKPKPLPGAPNV
jgi:hypothetical protein